MTVRIAGQEDAAGLWALLHLMHDENGVAPIDDEKLKWTLARGLARDKAVIGVIGDVGAPVASVGLYAGEWWYSTEQHLEDLWNFVHPEHRRSTYAKDLIQFAKRASDDLGIPLLMGVLSTERTKAKVRLYERQLPFAGAIFLYPGVKAEDVSHV